MEKKKKGLKKGKHVAAAEEENVASEAEDVFAAGAAGSPQCVMLSISGCCSTSSFLAQLSAAHH